MKKAFLWKIWGSFTGGRNGLTQSEQRLVFTWKLDDGANEEEGNVVADGEKGAVFDQVDEQPGQQGRLTNGAQILAFTASGIGLK
jgi:hypothetical protein